MVNTMSQLPSFTFRWPLSLQGVRGEIAPDPSHSTTAKSSAISQSKPANIVHSLCRSSQSPRYACQVQAWKRLPAIRAFRGGKKNHDCHNVAYKHPALRCRNGFSKLSPSSDDALLEFCLHGFAHLAHAHPTAGKFSPQCERKS